MQDNREELFIISIHGVAEQFLKLMKPISHGVGAVLDSPGRAKWGMRRQNDHLYDFLDLQFVQSAENSL